MKEPWDKHMLMNWRKWKTSNLLSGRRTKRSTEWGQGGFRPGRRASEQLV